MNKQELEKTIEEFKAKRSKSIKQTARGLSLAGYIESIINTYQNTKIGGGLAPLGVIRQGGR